MLNLNLNSMLCNNRPPFTPPNPSEAQQWLGGAERFVGDSNGNDEIVLSFVPDCVFNANCTIKTKILLDGVTVAQYMFNAANAVNTNVLCAGYVEAGAIRFIVRDKDGGNLTTLNFGSWDGISHPEYRINGTSIECYVNGVKKGSTGVIPDISNFDLFPFDVFYIGSRGNVDVPILGKLWDFEISGLSIPINEGVGTDIHDSNGNIVGTLNDQPVTNFWGTKLLPDKLGGGAYGLHDLTVEVVDAAIADRLVFNNEGLDFIDIGRPAEVINKTRPSLDLFTIRAVCWPFSDINSYYLVSLQDSGVGSASQFSILLDVGSIVCKAGRDYTATSLTYVPGQYMDIRFSVGLTGVSISLNGEIQKFASAPLPVTTTASLFFGGRTDGTIVNFEGQQSYVEIYEGYDENCELENLDVIECWPLDNFDGGKVKGSVLGLEGVVTDGTPFTIQDKGIATKYNLNAHGLVTTTGFAGDEWLTRAEIDALHNDTTIFTGDSGLSVLRSLPYDDANTLDAGQIAKINSYMGR